jgi:hypothetical protein
MISPEELRNLFNYNPETGDLTWKIPGARRRKAGDIAGCKTSEGRIIVGINKKIYKAHRIIWAIQTGEWPQNHIDHINEDATDNRWVNLREANKSQNMCNITRIKSNTSGYKGVTWSKATQKWRAQIKLNNKSYHLGVFQTKEDAAKAYQEAAKRLHGEFCKH